MKIIDLHLQNLSSTGLELTLPLFLECSSLKEILKNRNQQQKKYQRSIENETWLIYSRAKSQNRNSLEIQSRRQERDPTPL